MIILWDQNTKRAEILFQEQRLWQVSWSWKQFYLGQYPDKANWSQCRIHEPRLTVGNQGLRLKTDRSGARTFNHKKEPDAMQACHLLVSRSRLVPEDLGKAGELWDRNWKFLVDEACLWSLSLPHWKECALLHPGGFGRHDIPVDHDQSLSGPVVSFCSLLHCITHCVMSLTSLTALWFNLRAEIWTASLTPLCISIKIVSHHCTAVP